MHPQPAFLPWVSSYGILLVAALVACWIYARRLAVEYRVDPSHVDLAVPLIFLFSVIGARLLGAAMVDDAGIGIHASHVRFRLFGLLLFAVPFLLVYARLSGQSFRALADLFALPAVLWLAVLRIGCFLAGCCWGDLVVAPDGVARADLAQVLTVPWMSAEWLPAIRFPAGSYAYEQHLALGLIGADAMESLPVHPTQLYELALLVPLLVWLRAARRGLTRAGNLALLTLGSYACLRFMLEFIRADSQPVMGPLTATQIICAVLVVLSFLSGRPGPNSVPRTRTSS